MIQNVLNPRVREAFFRGLLAIVASCVSAPAVSAVQAADNRWENEIQAFERQDTKRRPPENAVLFVGSSSVRLWKLEESFPKLGAINRGFGGSQLADAVHFAERIVIPYRPRLVVLYAGDKRLSYVDVFQPMLTADAEPRPELFRADGVHLNAEGYQLWASVLQPTLERQ